METRLVKHKKYRESLIQQGAISRSEVEIKGRHSAFHNNEILPFNDVIDLSSENKKKEAKQNELLKEKNKKIAVVVTILSIVIFGIIIFAIVAFGGI